MSFRLGADVGGTFTDLLLINDDTGATYTAKVPSTPADSSVGVLNGIEKICRTSGIDPKQIRSVMHGTTVATNAILTQKVQRLVLSRLVVTGRCCTLRARLYRAAWAAG
ncbi:MAG: hypothetical protein MH208_13345 [Marinobacter sp.]|nr:hypothetical protein [Marinobacter sp.]